MFCDVQRPDRQGRAGDRPGGLEAVTSPDGPHGVLWDVALRLLGVQGEQEGAQAEVPISLVMRHREGFRHLLEFLAASDPTLQR